MSDLSAFYGPNAGYVLELYDRYLEDSSSVDDESRQFFSSFDPATLDAAGAAAGAASGEARESVTAPGAELQQIIGAVQLATAIREYGHLAVQTDPLGSPPPGAPELDAATYGISEEDLVNVPANAVGGAVVDGSANALEAIRRLRERYTTTIGFDFDHIQVAEERKWLERVAESGEFDFKPDNDAKRRLLERLTQVEGFERFLHQTYLGQKRFSIEGVDAMIPMLDMVIAESSGQGAEEVFIGMAHRGRLNVLTHILSKPYGAIIAQFEGRHDEATPPSGFNSETESRAGDVKYHLGARLTKNPETGERVKLPVILAPNPSHLEAVNPVVLGMTRAAQDDLSEPGLPPQDKSRATAILIHGDAAFTGQGIVQETLNMAALNGFNTGGTIHIIANNQIGYTTDWMDSRSTFYSSDPARGFEIPIVHVNADDPIACLTATHIAMAYRKQFGKDFVIDLVGYRRWGHNEGDEPLFTQPLMYKTIQKHPTVRKVFGDRLVAEGVMTHDEVEAVDKKIQERLTKIRRGITEGQDTYPSDPIEAMRAREEVETALEPERMRSIQTALHEFPADFSPNSKIKRQMGARAQVLDQEDGKLDWGHAESMAFAAILQEGIPIRITGEDAQRGTFSHRHVVLHDSKTGETYTPLHHIPDAKASFAIYNSPLSEYAGLGFEYGYSVEARHALVLWEAQFGDFVNGAQIIIDQFLVSARSKWSQTSGLVLLLPHGYEGQGPEHSSARLERFLQLAAQDNIRVANVTSAAQYFHLLRRQAARLESDPRPLVIMTPKSLLRHPMAASPMEAFTSGTFMPVLDDPLAQDRKERVTRLIFCSGKVAIDLEQAAERDNASVAVARVEQLAPFQTTALSNVISSYPNLREIVWLQEEPRNMGSWGYIGVRLRDLVEDRIPVRYIGRPEQASPAEGYAAKHKENQDAIIAAAYADVLPMDDGSGGAQVTNGKEDDKAAARKKDEVSVGTAD
jgi:2-oxoglutarate dehydrogenase E1 component